MSPNIKEIAQDYKICTNDYNPKQFFDCDNCSVYAIKKQAKNGVYYTRCKDIFKKAIKQWKIDEILK